MKYVILIYSNAESRKLWQQFSETERGAGLAHYARFDDELEASGELVVSQALADHSTAKRVRVDEGRTLTTDGPFAEAKEHLAGFYLLDVASEERAIEIAAKVPEAALGLVEVRPARSLDLAEW
ncbi:YciI family protein [Pseudonocardia adelaidensis]|uniref:YciI family protein n=1 Tax=Pseudonocardia adelaidensis TaxID=648754 RepID=A0ABP9NP77_9PSEU